MALPILTSPIITLRPITENDTDLIVFWRNSDFVRCNFIYRDDFTAEMHNRWLKQEVFTGRVIQFIIEYKTDENVLPIGSVYLRDIDYENSCAEFGIFIGEKVALGKGFGTITTEMVLDYAHNQLGLHRVFLRLLADNISAYKAYRKAGFVLEGVFRDMKKIDGKYKDIMFMSSIKTKGSNSK